MSILNEDSISRHLKKIIRQNFRNCDNDLKDIHRIYELKGRNAIVEALGEEDTKEVETIYKAMKELLMKFQHNVKFEELPTAEPSTTG